jgi:uroporphyrin-III C-methyltransferase/precorrin-2 dehydrogenase/sirohydrochlorin ferrochelatase
VVPVLPVLPIFLRLQGRPVLLVGGGPVAASKLSALLDAGGQVTVVAPEVLPELERPGVRVLRRPFAPADLDGVWLAVAAAPGPVNREVAAAAEPRRVFVNAADDLEAASAFLGGVVRRGDVTVAISTGGGAPAFAGLLREALDAVLPEEVGAWLDLARRVREEHRRDRVPFGERRPLLLRALLALHGPREAQ